jgi:F0F1-type ATP synthase alpha subunit
VACCPEHLLRGVLVLYDDLTDKAVECRRHRLMT